MILDQPHPTVHVSEFTRQLGEAAIDPANIQIRVDRAQVVLGGRAESYFEKQMIQEAARRSFQRRTIRNHICVDR